MSNERQHAHTPEQLNSLLEDLDGGTFAAKIAAALKASAESVANWGAKGKTGKVSIDFTFARIGDSRQVDCVHAIKFITLTRKGRLIDEDTTSTPLYVGARGQLSLFPIQEQDTLFARGPRPE
jgi:D-serine deaminase-like pyridoxal phosphate-dependent protein